MSSREVGHAPSRAGARQWAGLAVLVLPVLIIAIDMTVLGFAVPFLSEDLAPTGGQLLWIVDIYSFMLAGLLITMGSLGDRIGRRRLLMCGAVGFGAASLLAAFAPTAEVLILARALLGLAGATLMPSTLSLLRNMFTDSRQRMIAVAVWGSGFSVGASVGPLIGGWLMENFHWGSVFLINLPVMALLLVLLPLLVPESRNPVTGPLDLLGVVMSMGAMLPAVYGVKQLAEYGLSPLPVVLLVLGLGLGVLFVRRQLGLAHPLIDVTLFRVRRFSVAILANFMLVLSLVSSLFFLTQYMQLVLGLSPARAGLVLVPGLLLSVVAGFVAVRMARRLRLGTVLLVMLLVVAVGFALITQAPLENGAPLIATAFVIIGLGIGTAETLTNDAVLSSAPPSRAGAAAAISETAYELGGALGVALLGSVLTAAYRVHMPDLADVPADQMDAARETLGGAVRVAEELPAEPGAELLAAAQRAFTEGMHLTSLVAVVIVASAAVMAAVALRHDRTPAAASTAAAAERSEREDERRTAASSPVSAAGAATGTASVPGGGGAPTVADPYGAAGAESERPTAPSGLPR